MAGSRAPDVLVTISVLDRLIDHEPRERTVEEAMTRSQSVRELKTALRRDLEWLLNSRRVATAPDEGLVELNRSVYVHGLPDFAGWSLNAPKDQIRMLRSLQVALKVFEPRLTKVNIVALESKVVATRTLRFRIDGLLMMDPAPERVSFDTVLDLTNSNYLVQGDANAG